MFFFFFLFFYYTNVYFRSTQRVETMMAATAARARDATRLEPLVYFYIYIYILLHSCLFRLIYLRGYKQRIGTTRVFFRSGRIRSGREGRWGLETRLISSPWCFFYVICITVSI